jgi:hypothetical protein
MNTSAATAEELYAALDADDVARIVAVCADDVTVRYPADGRLPYGGSWEGRKGIEQFLDAHDAAEEIVEFEVRRMIAEGDTVIAIGHFVGRAKPDGGQWSTDFVHQLTITDGRLQRWEAFFDTAAAISARENL